MRQLINGKLSLFGINQSGSFLGSISVVYYRMLVWGRNLMFFLRNFDFDNGTPLEGRYSWEEAAPSDVPLPYLQVMSRISVEF